MSRSAWVCLNFGTNRQYAGNQGYDDDLASYYRYDSFVPNHRSVKTGDVLLICDHERLMGEAVRYSDQEEQICGISLNS